MVEIKELSVECLKKRIIRAIKHGNTETRYIIEACKAEFSYYNFCKALAELQTEGVVIFHNEPCDNNWYTLA